MGIRVSGRGGCVGNEDEWEKRGKRRLAHSFSPALIRASQSCLVTPVVSLHSTAILPLSAAVHLSAAVFNPFRSLFTSLRSHLAPVLSRFSRPLCRRLEGGPPSLRRIYRRMRNTR